jgi:hypothetical protein
MKKILNIYEPKEVLPHLESRGLIKQYKKVKEYLLRGNLLQARFKERNPRGSGIWYFRINRQFRALGVFDKDGNLIIFEIDNHQ